MKKYAEYQFQYAEFLYINIYIWNESFQYEYSKMWGFY